MDAGSRGPEPFIESLESRDNPFLPGGELSREAEDLLRRATIIRDNFYLNEEEKRTLQEHQQQQQQQQQQHQQQQKQRSAKKVQIIDQDGQTYDSEKQPSSPTYPGNVEERISPQSAGNTLAAVPQGDGLQPKENGKAADGAAASPDNVKLTIPDSDGQSIPLTQSGPGGGLSGDLQVHDSDKKRRNKCCSIM